MSEQIQFGDRTVTLVTCWQPMSWELHWDDGLAAYATPEQRDQMERHRGHHVSYLDSLLGWRAIHCADCDQRLWDIHDAPAVSEEER